MSNGGLLAASTRHKPNFLDSFLLFAVRHHREACKGSATEQRADGARAFEVPHIAIGDRVLPLALPAACQSPVYCCGRHQSVLAREQSRSASTLDF
jgi:hypothetical protein